MENFDIVNEIYNEIFCNIQHGNIDLFLCGAASTKEKTSYRDIIRGKLEDNANLSILYPEDMFMEMLNRKKYDLLTLEKFLASNSDIILIVCESPGSFTELGAFVNNSETLEKVVVLLSESADNIDRYTVLKEIGADEKIINHSLFKQIGMFFLLPLVVASIHSIFGIQFAAKIMEDFGSGGLTGSIVITAIIFAIIYGLYFVITYIGSKNMIKASFVK